MLVLFSNAAASASAPTSVILFSARFSVVYSTLLRSMLFGDPTSLVTVREKSTLLSVIFGDTEALALLRRTLADVAADIPSRQLALGTVQGHRNMEGRR